MASLSNYASKFLSGAVPGPDRVGGGAGGSGKRGQQGGEAHAPLFSSGILHPPQQDQIRQHGSAAAGPSSARGAATNHKGAAAPAGYASAYGGYAYDDDVEEDEDLLGDPFSPQPSARTTSKSAGQQAQILTGREIADEEDADLWRSSESHSHSTAEMAQRKQHVEAGDPFLAEPQDAQRAQPQSSPSRTRPASAQRKGKGWLAHESVQQPGPSAGRASRPAQLPGAHQTKKTTTPAGRRSASPRRAAAQAAAESIYRERSSMRSSGLLEDDDLSDGSDQGSSGSASEDDEGALIGDMDDEDEDFKGARGETERSSFLANDDTRSGLLASSLRFFNPLRKHKRPRRSSTMVSSSDAGGDEEATDGRDSKFLASSSAFLQQGQPARSSGEGKGKARASFFGASVNEGVGEEEEIDLESSSTRIPGSMPGSEPRAPEDEGGDAFVYPAPPASAGWTPWANRLAYGDYKDKFGLAAFAAALLLVALFGGATALAASPYTSPPSSSPNKPSPSTRPSSYFTITRSIPLLCLLLFLSLAAGVLNLLIIRHVARLRGAATNFLRVTLTAIPAILCLGWLWAFAGSFFYDDEGWTGGSWGTTGLRLLSLVPLVLAALFSRAVWKRRKALSRSIAVLELSATIVTQHPALILLSLVGLAFYIAVSIPFLAVFTRLFLVGHYGSLANVGSGRKDNEGSGIWHTDGTAKLLAWITLGTWLWTWAVLRGIQRVTIAGVVSHWYFHRKAQHASSAKTSAAHAASADDQDEESIIGFGVADNKGAFAPGGWPSGDDEMTRSPIGEPSSLEIVRASFIRATGPAMGTICASAFVLALAQLGIIIAEQARRTSRVMTRFKNARGGLAVWMQPLAHVVAILAGLTVVLHGVSTYVLIYVGITGESFFVASKRSARLAGLGGIKGVMDGLIIDLVLDLTAIALSLLAGVAGFLFSAHQLHVPADAPFVGLLCALLPYGVLRLCADTLSNTADTLYICYAIDRAADSEHCSKAVEAFETTESR